MEKEIERRNHFYISNMYAYGNHYDIPYKGRG